MYLIVSFEFLTLQEFNRKSKFSTIENTFEYAHKRMAYYISRSVQFESCAPQWITI